MGSRSLCSLICSLGCPVLRNFCQFLSLSQLNNDMLIEEVSNSNSVSFFFLSFVWTAGLLINMRSEPKSEPNVLFSDLSLI